MNNTTALRSLVTFGILIPIAIFMGYTLADPLQYSTFATIGIVFTIMAIPLLLKWHQPLLLLSWNMGMTIPFIKGQPNLWLVMAVVTFSIAVLERCLNRNMEFLQVKSVTAPLLFLVAVVLVTAKLTGGFGLKAFGSEVYGGKKYIFLIGAIGAYFALTAWRIPPERARLYISLFLLGGTLSFISDLYPVAPSWAQGIFWFFPPSIVDTIELGKTRLGGVGATGQALLFFMIFRYGIRGIFLSGRPLRLFLFLLFFSISFLGGFRSTFLAILLTIFFQFVLEGLHKTKLVGVFGMIGLLIVALIVPLAPKLPFTIQRSLAVFPLDLDPAARVAAEETSQWRINMWTALLPQIPEHLLLGKGYAISMEDFQLMGYDSSFANARTIDASQQALALSGDYHNGPLSVILPFGIWGVIAFAWFLWAGGKVLIRNYRYGESSLKLINTFLLASFLMHLTMFLFVIGALQGDMWTFVGLVGISIALNNGMAKRPVQIQKQPVPLQRPRLIQAHASFPR